MNKFQTDIKRGKIGEEKVHQYLLSRRNVSKVVDVSGVKQFQQMDIDFFIEKTDGTIYSIEVKTDSYLTDNFIYEKYSNKHIQSKGCFEKTQADYIFYYFINKKLMYIFETKKLRKFVRDREKTGQFTLIPMGDNALGYKIPRSSLTPFKDYVGCITLH